MAIQWTPNNKGGLTAKGTKWQADCYPDGAGAWTWHFIDDTMLAGAGGTEASEALAVKAMAGAAADWISSRLSSR
jgi:hypothetical protein